MFIWKHLTFMPFLNSIQIDISWIRDSRFCKSVNAAAITSVSTVLCRQICTAFIRCNSILVSAFSRLLSSWSVKELIVETFFSYAVTNVLPSHSCRIKLLTWNLHNSVLLIFVNFLTNFPICKALFSYHQ